MCMCIYICERCDRWDESYVMRPMWWFTQEAEVVGSRVPSQPAVHTHIYLQICIDILILTQTYIYTLI
jgi:hypothetical protein